MRKQTLISLFAALTPLAGASPTFTVHDLGSAFIPNSISPTTGYVVGYNKTSSPTRHAYFTFNGNTLNPIYNVPILPGSTLQNVNLAVLVNDLGTIAGTAGPEPLAYAWNLVTNPTPYQIAPLADDIPRGINSYTGVAGGQICGMNSTQQGMIWYNGPGSASTTIPDPFVPSHIGVEFWGMNKSQICIGTYYNGSNWISCTYVGGTFTAVPSCYAVTGINSATGSRLCGSYNSTSNPYNPTACYWATPTSSPTALSSSVTMTSSATAISDSNWVVGNYTVEYPTVGTQQAFVWTPTYGFQTLPTITSAIGVDTAGDIIGTALVGSGMTATLHGFLLVVN